MAYQVFTPITFLVYRNGLFNLLNEEWLYNILPSVVERIIIKNESAKGLFFKPNEYGILFFLGRQFFDNLFAIEDDLLGCDINKAYIECSQLHFMLVKSGITNEELFMQFLLLLDEVEEIISETPINRQQSVFHKKMLHYQLSDTIEEIRSKHKFELLEIRDLYARNFAERILHDRQLCEWISFTFLNLYGEKGYPQKGENGVVYAKISRERMPTWVSRTLLSRERNLCANCHSSFQELHDVPHIDHIIPLAQGGNNDISNLQLLCSSCNSKKSKNIQYVQTSIPNYVSSKFFHNH